MRAFVIVVVDHAMMYIDAHAAIRAEQPMSMLLLFLLRLVDATNSLVNVFNEFHAFMYEIHCYLIKSNDQLRSLDDPRIIC